MCGCERHRDRSAPCNCECNHKEDYIAAEEILAGDAVVVGVTEEGQLVAHKQPRLKRYVYRHSHDCNMKGEFYTHYPMSVGGVMFPNHPVCIEAEVPLMLVRVEEV
jgi:hypothetical protein